MKKVLPIVLTILVVGLASYLALTRWNWLRNLVNPPEPSREAWVAYLSPTYGAHQLWARPVSGGSALRLSAVEGSVLEYGAARDGNQVAFTAENQQGGADLWLVNRQGKKQRRLVECGAQRCASPAWNPDGKTLVYVRANAPVNGPFPTGELWLVDLATGQTAPIQRAQMVHGSEPIWSPDGSRLAFYDPDVKGLRLLSWQGKTEVRLEPIEPGPVSFSPDGNRVAYLSPAMDGFVPYNRVVVYDFKTQAIQTFLGKGEGVMDYSLPFWSPDGKEIAVGMRPPMGNPAREIWLLKADGTPVKKLLADASQNYAVAGWEASGERLLLQQSSMMSLKEPSKVVVWERGSGEARILAEDGLWPNWLP